MNVLEVLGVVVVAYFVFVAVWLTRIEDYLAESGRNRTETTRGDASGGDARGE